MRLAAPLHALQTLRWRIVQAVRRALLSAGPASPVLKTYRALRSMTFVRAAWRLFNRNDAAGWLDTATYAAAGGVFAPGTPEGGDLSEPPATLDAPGFFEALLRRIEACRPHYAPAAGRIILINNGLSAGGAERQIVYTLTGLARRGRDVRFLGEYLGLAPGLHFHLDAVREAGVAARAPRPVRRPTRQVYGSVTREVADCLSRFPPATLMEILAMVDELREARPAVVHLWQDETAIKHAVSALIAGVPKIVLSGRNLNPTHFLYHRSHMRAAYRALARSESVVLSNNSHAGAASYADWLGVDAGAIRVVHNGVDTKAWPARSPGELAAWRAGHALEPGVPVVVGVFRLAEEKRPLLWLDVAAQVHRRAPAVRFLLIGDGPMREPVDARVRELGLGDVVTHLGEIADVSLAIAASDAFMLTSAQEGLPNVLLEAQWHGLRCLTTDAGGAREAIQDSVTGVLAKADDPQHLADSLLRLLGDDALKDSAAREGPLFVTRSFGLERMLDETEALYASA